MFAIVRKCNKSKNAMERLEKECGIKLVGLCPTRWSSTFLVVERLLRVRDGLNKVCQTWVGTAYRLVTGLYWRL